MRRAQLSVRCSVFAGSLRAGMGRCLNDLRCQPTDGAPRLGAKAGRWLLPRRVVHGPRQIGHPFPGVNSRSMGTFLQTATHRAHTSALNTLAEPAKRRALRWRPACPRRHQSRCVPPTTAEAPPHHQLDITGKAPVADRLTGEEFDAMSDVRDVLSFRTRFRPGPVGDLRRVASGSHPFATCRARP